MKLNTKKVKKYQLLVYVKTCVRESQLAHLAGLHSDQAPRLNRILKFDLELQQIRVGMETIYRGMPMTHKQKGIHSGAGP